MTKQIHCIGRKRRCYRRPKSQAALMQPRATFCDSSGNLHRVFSTLKLFFLLMFSKYPQFDILHQISKVLEVVKWSPHHQGTFAETLLSTAGNTSHSLLAVGALAGLIGSSGSSWVHPPQENIVFQHTFQLVLCGMTFGWINVWLLFGEYYWVSTVDYEFDHKKTIYHVLGSSKRLRSRSATQPAR